MPPGVLQSMSSKNDILGTKFGQIIGVVRQSLITFELSHDKTNKIACAPSEDSGQPGHLPSLIRVFAVHMKKVWVLSYPLRAKADLSLRWAHRPFCGGSFHLIYMVHAAITLDCYSAGRLRL